jgi:Flp pilus assembly protein TadB
VGRRRDQPRPILSHVDPAEFEKYARSQARARASLGWSLIALAVVVGYAFSLWTELWAGGLVTLALVPVAVRVLFSWDRARLVKRFPELEGPNTKWPRVRDWVVGKRPTVRAGE